MRSALLGKVGCLRLAGSQPGSLGLTAYQRQRLSINYPTSPAQVGMGTVSSTQGSLKRLGDPAELTWETAGKVAGGPLTQHYQHPAPLAGMAAEAPPPAPRASSGPSSLVLECSPMHASPSPLILRAKLAWGSANPTKSSPGALNYSSLPPYPTLHHTVVQVGSRMDQDMGRNTALAGINRAVSAAWART